jgi:periplasmic copper chaperone A
VKNFRALAALCLVAAMPAWAAAQVSPLIVQQAWMRQTPGGDTAAVYLTLQNTSMKPIIVIGVQTPYASTALLHSSSVQKGQARMRAKETLVIAPGQKVAFEPGGTHVMLSGFKRKVGVGQAVPLIFLLADGAQVKTAVVVRPLGAQ